MDLNYLLHFVAVAERLNFRQAAAHLGVAQPQLSRSIQRLERILGTSLFERNRHKVALTRAGTAFLGEAKYLLARMDFAKRLVRRTGAAEDALSISFIATALADLIPRALERFQAKLPEVALHLTECDSSEQISGLLEGRFDVGFVAMSAIEGPDLQCRVVQRLSYIAAVPETSPLARKRQIRLADLSAFPFILSRQTYFASGYTKILLACQDAGFVPKVSQEAQQTHTVFHMVRSGLGVALVTQSARVFAPKGVALVPVSDLPDYLFAELAMAWMQRPVSKPLRTFIEIVESLPEANRGGRPT